MAMLWVVSATGKVFFMALFMDFRVWVMKLVVWGMKLVWWGMELVWWLMEFSVWDEEYFRECVCFMLGSLYICGRIVWDLLQVFGRKWYW